MVGRKMAALHEIWIGLECLDALNAQEYEYPNAETRQDGIGIRDFCVLTLLLKWQCSVARCHAQ